MYVLGISRVHDSAAALVRDGEIIAFAEEERFTRKKHDGGFPAEAIKFCLERAGITLADVDHVAYYWQRWKEGIHAAKVFARYFPGTLDVFRNPNGDEGGRSSGMVDTFKTGGGSGHDDYHVGGAVLAHIKRSYTLEQDVKDATGWTGPTKFKTHLVDHHRAHAASGYFISPWDESAVLTFDGIGSDGTATYLAHGRGNKIVDLRRIKFPHSLGAMYAGVTGYLGFYPTRDEGKIMGLAPLGEDTYVDAFKQLIHLDDDGGFELDLSWFAHHRTGKHVMAEKFSRTFGPARPKTRVTAANPVPQHYCDIAYALQVTLEEAGLHLARWLQRETGSKRLCVAGGVALNSVMNGRILLETPFEDFFAQPAAADDGCALGAALEVSVGKYGKPRPREGYTYTGPDYTEAEMEVALQDSRRRVHPRRRHRRAHRREDRRRPDRRLGAGPDGVRAAGAGQPLARRRPARPGVEDPDEREGQAPRGVPAVRAVVPGRARGRVLRQRLPVTGDAAGVRRPARQARRGAA